MLWADGPPSLFRRAVVASFWSLLFVGVAVFFFDLVTNIDTCSARSDLGEFSDGSSLLPRPSHQVTLPFPSLYCSSPPPLPPIEVFGLSITLPHPPSCSPGILPSDPTTTSSKLLGLYMFCCVIPFLFPILDYFLNGRCQEDGGEVSLSNIIITSLCLLSIALDPPSLLSLSPLQLLVFFVFSSVVSFDGGDWVVRAICGSERFGGLTLVHHFASVVGLGVLIFVGLGGGAIVRLLLDYGTIIFFSFRVRYWSPWYIPFLGVFFLVFVFLRLVWYPYVMVMLLVELWVSPFFSMLVFVMLWLWFGFATLYNLEDGWVYIIHFYTESQRWARRKRRR